MICGKPGCVVMAASLLLAACAASSISVLTPPGEPDAIECALYHIDHRDGDPGYQVLVKPGMQKQIEVGGVRLAVRYDEQSTVRHRGIGLEAYAGDVQLFRALYQLPGRPPENQFLGDHGFTGLLYFSHPTAGGNYQASCKSVDSRTHARSETREQFLARSQAEARRKAAHVAALHERQACALTPEQARAGERCPLKHSLSERVAAILALHAEGERKFAGIDLRAAELANADLRECDLVGARLDGAQLSSASLYFAKLERAVLRGARLIHANLYAAQLGGADLTHAKAERVNFERALLPGAQLALADLPGAYVVSADLSSADLSGARLVSADLTHANLTAATLNGANLASVNLTHAILDSADLRGVQQLDQRQLDRACGDEKTILPPGLDIRREPRTEVQGFDIPPCDLELVP